jgi:hypothetical protein
LRRRELELERVDGRRGRQAVGPRPQRGQRRARVDRDPGTAAAAGFADSSVTQIQGRSTELNLPEESVSQAAASFRRFGSAPLSQSGGERGWWHSVSQSGASPTQKFLSRASRATALVRGC